MDEIGLYTLKEYFEGDFITIPCPPAYLIVMKNNYCFGGLQTAQVPFPPHVHTGLLLLVVVIVC